MLNQLQRLGRKRGLVVAVIGFVALAVAGTTFGYSALTKSVTLDVEGSSQQVTVLGSTVGDVLADQGITIGSHDEVAPALDEKVVDGTKISVRYGRQVELTIDGRQSTYWVTATDVGTALDQIGRSFARSDLSISRGAVIGRGGIAVEVTTPKTVRLTVGAGKQIKRTVPADTVGDLLDELGVVYDDDDIVKPALDRKLRDGARIQVTKIRIVKKHLKHEPIDFATVKQEDDTRPVGQSSVVREGRRGERDVVYKLTYRNGKLIATKVVRQRVVVKPIDALISVGTQPVTPTFVDGNTVWDALARCESGGNWSINTGNGYYGGLQFSLGTWRAYGGTGLPSQHSREEQIRIATLLRNASGGYGAWPGCAAKLGLPR